MQLEVAICEDGEEATRRGYVYRKPVFQPATLTKAVLIKHGTVSGKSTIDLIFETPDGQKFVAMTTATLLNLALAESQP